MPKSIKNVVVTGGAGQIAYSLLFRIAHGDMLGYDQPVALHILEVPSAMQALEGVKMELEDCAFPLLKHVSIGSDPYEIFKGAHYALLVGAKPRGPGMERSDLLNENGKIFIEQGRALNAVADPNVKVLVVGNPCNTNCLILMHHAPDIPKKNFHAMMRLDQNRSAALLAKKANTDVSDVTHLIVWGNHSITQVPDYFNANVRGKHVPHIIEDKDWLEKEFMPTVQKRGAAIIAARGKSSAASAAAAAIDSIKALLTPTPEGQCFSSGVYSTGNSYGIADNLVFSFPCRSNGDGNYEIIDNVPWNDALKEKIKASEKELLDERSLVSPILKGEP